LEDYRNANEKFDRVYSIGFFEHVGMRNFREYFSVVERFWLMMVYTWFIPLHSVTTLSPGPVNGPTSTSFLAVSSHILKIT
jgi:cyclopropane fatty-acyl-phospholipid synthase-like methyltransferase